MKKQIVILMMCCMVPLAGAGYVGTVLFSDSYDRANNTDIDASSAGMAGTLSPMTYMESWEGSGLPTSIQIVSNQLDVAFGPAMSSLYLNHNFTDAAILSAGGFSITLDVVSIVTSDDAANRYGGFGVGMTQAEAAAAGDINESATTMRARGILAGSSTVGICDFFVDVALDNNLRMWHNGTLLNTIAVGAAAGTIKAEFYPTSFNAGSVVTAVVYFNGVQKAIQTFTWDNTGANYIGISGRAPANGVVFDNLAIATCYSERAQNPVPVNNTVNVDPETLVLQWNKGKDASGNPNANIARHYLYIAETEPNFVDMTPVTVANTADPITHNPVSIDATDMDKTFYWRVDESVLVGGTPSGPSDGNTVTGFTWKFETLKSIPVINSQPINQLVDADQTATFTISVSSVSAPLNYQWYKSADNANDTPGDDTPVGIDANSLVISNAQIGDEGYYFCAATNPAATVNSNVVSLGIKRLAAHWSLDASDYVGGFYQDLSGEGHHAEPNLAPAAGSFVTGVDPAETGDALDTMVVPLSVADSGEWAAAAFTSQVTVSAWLKWAGANGAWQGIVSNRVDPTNGNFYIEIRQDNGNVQIGSPGGIDLTTGNLPVGQWTHLAVTASSAGRTIYINGLPVITRTPANAITQLVVPMYLGALDRGTTLNSPFNGVIDDVRIYNFAKDKFAVADLYYAIQEIPLCLNPNNVDLQFDIAGGGINGDEPDCKINLADFAMFAQNWLKCGSYPQTVCQ